jgi:hypothetical protein
MFVGIEIQRVSSKYKMKREKWNKAKLEKADVVILFHFEIQGVSKCNV